MLTVDTLLISIASEGQGGRIGRIYSTGDKVQEIGAKYGLTDSLIEIK